jgi:hypothetical protein
MNRGGLIHGQNTHPRCSSPALPSRNACEPFADACSEFNFIIPDEDMEKVATFGEAVKLIERIIAAKP